MRASTRAVTKGITFLHTTQSLAGGFPTQLSPTLRRFACRDEQQTVFGPALMLQALHGVDGADAVRKRLAEWLLKQQGANGAFNYWAVDSPQRQNKPYPDDLDDTACALAGLYLHDPNLLDSAQLANLVRLLISVEREVGGPYNTWLVNTEASPDWRDIDLVVNSNILFLLQLAAEPIPKLQAFIARAVESQDFQSSYYPLPMAVVYFIARTSPGGNTRHQLIKYILDKRRAGGFWQSPVQTAWACVALRRLDHNAPQPKALAYLLRQQLPDGSWPAESVWLDERHGQRKRYAGSGALSTAFVLEALTCLQAKSRPKSLKRPDSLRTTFQRIVASVTRQVVSWPSAVRTSAFSFLEKLQKGDTGWELVLLPQLFARSLERPPQLPAQFLANLSRANVFGWLAFTIYDDFLDGEGEAQLLPVANVAMRESLVQFASALPDNQPFQRLVHSIFNRIDGANAWEVANCRFTHDAHSITISSLPKYPDPVFLAERSIGHMLTPLAVLAATGKALEDQQVKRFMEGFQHYLAARQLNDDLHDWQDDLRNGQISYVTAKLLHDMAIKKSGKHSIAILLPKMERHFWQVALGELCAETSQQLALSRRKFIASGLFRSESPLFDLLGRLEQSMTRTLDEQKRAQEFLQYYTKEKSPR